MLMLPQERILLRDPRPFSRTFDAIVSPCATLTRPWQFGHDSDPCTEIRTTLLDQVDHH
jgi:hypothetical protein